MKRTSIAWQSETLQSPPAHVLIFPDVIWDMKISLGYSSWNTWPSNIPFTTIRATQSPVNKHFFSSNQSDLIIWSFMPWILHCFLQWPSFSFLFEDRWVLVVRMMHPQLATEPYRFFSRAWTRRSCFETWDEERHQQLTQLTNGAAKKGMPRMPGERLF